jgi:hypothetical protein
MKRKICFYQLRLLAILVFFLTAFFTNAQERPPLTPKTTKSLFSLNTVVSPFEINAGAKDRSNLVQDATYLKLNASNLKSALKEQSRELVFRIPQKDGKTLELLLERQDILAPGFVVTNEKGAEIPFQAGQYYRGKVLSRKSESIAALSINGDEIMAMMTIDGESYVLGPVSDAKGKHNNEYVLYNDKNLQVVNPFHCGTSIEEHQVKNTASANNKAGVGKNIVRVQFEADHQMFLDRGSNATNTSNYVTGLFNMVATIYHNENIVTQISKIVVWTVPDPYGISSSVGSGAVLNAFRDRKNITGITGDLAHLLSTKPVGHGGIAWIDVLCFPTIGYRTAYSNISNSYNNFPLYSWTIDVVTHEMGHNLGSPHTHDCVWGAGGNQALDNCAAPAGGCAAGPAPANGGTIMSYCHLTAGGKNFNLGFGSQPGNLIRSKVNGAACLSKAYISCAGAQPIYCGEPVNGSTVGGVNNVTTYGCNSWNESGPEKVFILQTTEPGTITASLSNLTADLDVIILDACSETNCLAEGNNVASIPNASPGMYIIVVDGYFGVAGNFTLTVTCNGHCFSTGNTNFEFINRVSMGTIDNLSGNNYGYADFTGLKTPVQRRGTVDFTLTPGFQSAAWNENWRIWIDLNQDQDFNDLGELVFSTASASSAPVNGTIYIPSYAKLGATRMRIAMRFGSLPEDCGTFYGEVEDYTVVIEPFCPSLGNTKYEFIDSVEVGSLVKGSGNNNGYADFTGLPALNLIKGDTIPVKLTPGFTGSTYPESWRIWIDLDQDFHFEADEMVFESPVASAAAQTGTFVVPESAITGTTRMRITMQYAAVPGDCSYSFWGETEDYTVSISPFCASKANATYEYIDIAGIGSLLNNSGNDGGYADFTDVVFSTTAGEAAGIFLKPGFPEAKYQEFWRVWVDYNQDQVFDDSEQVFEAGPSDDVILGAFIVPDTTAEGIYGVRISMRYGSFPPPCGNFAWGEVEDYSMKISASEGGKLTTGSQVETRSSESNNGTSPAGLPGGEVKVFPNPVKDVLFIDWQQTEPVAIQVVSPTGQVIQKFDSQAVPAEIAVTGLPAGLYLLHAVTTDQQVIIKRFVKAE